MHFYWVTVYLRECERRVESIHVRDGMIYLLYG